MNTWYDEVAARAEHRCEYCGAPEATSNLPFETEHILPKSQGGSEDISNLALACRSCNLYKSDAVSGYDEESGTRVRLFHPRWDQWQEHFALLIETGEILGRTAIGRVTVAQLRINSNFQKRARLIWLRHELL